jgi:cadmium resistance protein CadD (predicted permease)
MADVLFILAVTAGAFAATNLDNLLLLVALNTRHADRPLPVLAGYFAAMLVVGALALTVGKLAGKAPVQYLGLLGVVPMAIGTASLVRLFRPTRGRGAHEPASGGAAFATTMTTQLSNGTDTVVTFSILFADSNDTGDYLVALAFVIMLCVFAAIALRASRHGRLRGLLHGYGRFAMPFILIAVGLYVLSNTGLDVLPGD